MATNSWQGDTEWDATWDTAANWDLGHSPTALEDVVINFIAGGCSKIATGPVGAAYCATLIITTAGAEFTLDLTNLTVTGNVTLDDNNYWDLKLAGGTLTAGTIISGTFTNASAGCTIKNTNAAPGGITTATNCDITGGTFVNITNTAVRTLSNAEGNLTITGDITLSGAVTHLIQNHGANAFIVASTVDIILVGDTTKCCMKNPLDYGGTFSTTSGATQRAADIVEVTTDADHIETGTTILTVPGTLVAGGGNILVV